MVFTFIVSGDQHTRFDSTGFNVEVISNVSSEILPVLGNTYRMPLPALVFRENGSALPLIALQYQAVELEVTLAPLYELYTALEVDSGNTGFGKRVIPSNESGLGIDKFVIDQTFVNSRNINLQLESAMYFMMLKESDSQYMNMNI